MTVIWSSLLSRPVFGVAVPGQTGGLVLVPVRAGADAEHAQAHVDGAEVGALQAEQASAMATPTTMAVTHAVREWTGREPSRPGYGAEPACITIREDPARYAP